MDNVAQGDPHGLPGSSFLLDELLYPMPEPPHPIIGVVQQPLPSVKEDTDEDTAASVTIVN